MAPSPVRIGLVFGGASGEHAVSIRSANTVIGALEQGQNQQRFSVAPFYIDQEGRWWPEAVARQVLASGVPAESDQLPQPLPAAGLQQLPERADSIDVWYPVLHGPNGEDGTVQGLFTLMGKPFVGAGVLGSAVAMDKLAMKAAFAAAGLAQVPYVGVNAAELDSQQRRDAAVSRIERELGYPCFVKPANLGSSVGISKARDRDQLIRGLEEAAGLDPRIVVEQGVNARELECAVLGKHQLRASVVGEIRFDADWYDYTTKYSDGLSTTLIPAPIDASIEQQVRTMALDACRALCVEGMARVDFFLDDGTGQLWINEINTLPGFTSLSMYPMLWKASGIELDELVAQLVESARE
ncbi:MAG: D-alanine--D-alanine ligase family protein [Synechococcus sp.]|nr:D-alanine--D-alanine ligase family protein [Synechococcus sp.]